MGIAFTPIEVLCVARLPPKAVVKAAVFEIQIHLFVGVVKYREGFTWRAIGPALFDGVFTDDNIQGDTLTDPGAGNRKAGRFVAVAGVFLCATGVWTVRCVQRRARAVLYGKSRAE